MQEAAADPKDPHGRNVPIRMGWAAAPLWPASSARKKSSTVWGDAVNAASRMESTGADSKIQVSQDVHACLKDAFVLKERGEIDVKGKGIMRTGSWWGESPSPRYTSNMRKASQSLQSLPRFGLPTHGGSDPKKCCELRPPRAPLIR